MKNLTAALALSLAAVLPFTASASLAETAGTQADLCVTAPAKAAKANIDCSATSSFDREDNAAAKKYPAGPVYSGGGIAF
ncbi:hypothetical protein [Hoeflea ulvae]|uniref:DUF680 domain-containing protein n=1 Tax=Hoeflea ulvae TaxID=2983764 RepID=A0ABT3YLI0_9HYPH|nr:hypothetical protein [Hoeflea ulvae]MCY0096629.1 hypothetical protein [Hoeflea ulvae]